MAILSPKAICPLCGSPLGDLSDVVAAPHFISECTHPLQRYCDSGMHRSCFLRWPQREAFIARFNETVWPSNRGMTWMMRDDGSIDDTPVPSPHPIRKRTEVSQAAILSERRPGIFLFFFQDRDAWDQTIVLSLRSELSADETRRNAPAIVKACAPHRYREVASGAASILLLPRPTSFAPDRTEFELERNAVDWEQTTHTKALVVAIPVDAKLTEPHVRAIHREKE